MLYRLFFGALFIGGTVSTVLFPSEFNWKEFHRPLAEEYQDITSQLDRGEVKPVLRQLRNAYQSAQSRREKADLLVLLAIAHERDQEQGRAIQTYLEALEATPRNTLAQPSKEEALIYKEAMRLYLDVGERKLHEISQNIVEKYRPVLREHPDYFLLAFLVAAAEANLGEREAFYARFYGSYQRYPESYMAYKSQGVLHLILSEKSASATERMQHQEDANLLICKAIEKNPSDSSLYKILIALARPEEKREVLARFIPQLLRSNAVIPRGEIAFYIHEMMAQGNYALTQRLLDKAQEWYQYSRVVQQAQRTLDAAKERQAG